MAQLITHLNSVNVKIQKDPPLLLSLTSPSASPFLALQERRSSAYGLALATFGLSYCIGPIAGGFLGERLSMTAVFSTSVLLAAFTVAYILFLLPESRPGNR